MSESERMRSREARLTIDRAARWPVALFVGTSILWLLAGSILALLASIKLHRPEFFADADWLTFGRVRPAHLNTMVYGWLSPAGVAVGLWILSRLCRAPINDYASLSLAGVLWNLGNLVGTVGILRGDSTSIEWLEYPVYATPLLLISFCFVVLTAVRLVWRREPGHIYVSQWYIYAAFFWFPLLYFASQMLLLWRPVQAPAQPPINWWFAHNVLGLWFTPLGLAAIYYLIPKVIGRPIHSYYLSVIGFWALAFFYAWNGMHHLIGGPYPAWLISASVVASVMMFIPVITVAINQHSTMVGHFSALRWSPTLRFVVFGGICYTAVSLQGSLTAIRAVNEVTHFTHYTVAHAHLGVYAFATMTIFGAVYYIMPRVLEREWPSAWLIRGHFWLCAVGVLYYWGWLTLGGILQGIELNLKATPFLEIVEDTMPYLRGRSIAGIMMTLGHVCFAVSFGWMLLKPSQAGTTATLLGRPRTGEANA